MAARPGGATGVPSPRTGGHRSWPLHRDLSHDGGYGGRVAAPSANTRVSAVANPARATVARRPGSARRTSHVDMLPLGGSSRDGLRFRAAARDVRTGTSGEAQAIDFGSLLAELDSQRRLRSLIVGPELPAASRLIDRVVGPGFRAALEETLPEQRRARTPLYLLLDDLPVAALIAGYADVHAKEIRFRPETLPTDVCAGWASDATMVRRVLATGKMTVTVGPAAPDLAASDPHGWHEMGRPAVGAMRRKRLIDVRVDGVAPDGAMAVRAMFRDTHVAPDGAERVLHEYDLEAAVDLRRGVITRCDARPMALPWPECPGAAGSASRLVGQPLGAVRDFVRSNLRGTSTCTHLNDLLRSVSDVVPLARALGVDWPEPA